VRGFDEKRGSYTMSYGSKALDGALLLLPALEFEPRGSPRIAETVAAIRQELSAGGPLLYRYPPGTDGPHGGEGPFLPVPSGWLSRLLGSDGSKTLTNCSRTFARGATKSGYTRN